MRFRIKQRPSTLEFREPFYEAQRKVMPFFWLYVGGGYDINSAKESIGEYIKKSKKPKIPRKVIEYIDLPTNKSGGSE